MCQVNVATGRGRSGGGARAKGTHPRRSRRKDVAGPGPAGTWHRGAGREVGECQVSRVAAHPAAPSCFANPSRWDQFEAAPHTCTTCLLRTFPRDISKNPSSSEVPVTLVPVGRTRCLTAGVPPLGWDHGFCRSRHSGRHRDLVLVLPLPRHVIWDRPLY